jgi:hypothetical protein
MHLQTQEDVDLVHRLRRGPAHPGSISAYSSTGFSSAGHSSAVPESPREVKKLKNLPKTTKQVISDNGGASTDLAQATATKQLTTRIHSLGTTFLKPSGVDEPADNAQGSAVIPQNSDIKIEARSPVKVTVKREREMISEHNDKERKKRKKKKKVVE